MFSFLNRREQEHTHNASMRANSAINRITISYISVLLLIALLSLFSYAALADATTNQKRIAVLTNTAGRQRVLSQEVALLSLQFVQTPPGDSRETFRTQILNQAAEMGANHQRLIDSDSNTNLSGRTLSPEIRAIYFDPPAALNTQVTDYLAAVHALTQIDDPLPDDPHLSHIMSHAPTLLERLDDVVHHYTAENIADTATLEHQERWAFISILALLLVVGLFVFRPMERRIHREQRLMFKEIEERKKFEEKLRESEKLFRMLVTHSPVGIFRTDVDGQYTFVNHPWSELTGFPEESALGSGWAEALHPDDRDLVIGFWQVTVEEKRELSLEYRYQRPDGEVVWVLANNVALRNDKGEVIGYLGTITNLTEHKKMEQELGEKEARFRQFADNINHTFWMATPDFDEVLYVSPAYEAIWGRSTESVYQNPLSFLESAHPEDRERVIDEYNVKLKLGSYHSEYRLVRPDGSIRWIHSHLFPIKNEEGCLYRVAGISEDITDHKLAEHQAMQLRVEKERVQMLSEFITTTSHELRTPLSTINTSVYLAQKQTDPANQTRYFEMIEARVWQLNRLIDQLQMMTKLDNLQDLEMTPLQMNQIIETIHSDLSEQAAAKQILMSVELQPQLPAIEADFDYIHHVIENLIENAIIYTPENGSITIRTFQSEDSVAVEIRDSGIGIKPENIDRIFDRFYKVNQARTANSSGAGLGLTMVKKIVELHNGTIDVESVPDKGSIFRIYLPTHQPAHHQLAPL